MQLGQMPVRYSKVASLSLHLSAWLVWRRRLSLHQRLVEEQLLHRNSREVSWSQLRFCHPSSCLGLTALEPRLSKKEQVPSSLTSESKTQWHRLATVPLAWRNSRWAQWSLSLINKLQLNNNGRHLRGKVSPQMEERKGNLQHQVKRKQRDHYQAVNYRWTWSSLVINRERQHPQHPTR